MGEEIEEVIWIVAVQLIKHTTDGIASTITLSWRTGGSEAEAIADGLRFALAKKPGFAIQQWIVERIPAVERCDPDIQTCLYGLGS